MTDNQEGINVVGVRTFDDVVVEWMKNNRHVVKLVTDKLFGFDNPDNITNESVEEFITDVLNRGLSSMAADVEIASKEATQ